MGIALDSIGDGIGAEFDGVMLGDARLEGRLRRIVDLASPCPGDSFPDQMGSVADRSTAVLTKRNSQAHVFGGPCF